MRITPGSLPGMARCPAMNSTVARPLVPGDIAIRSVVPRAAFAALQGAVRNVDPARIAQERWGADAPVVTALLRAATDPATTTDPLGLASWPISAVGLWLPTLAPESAAAALIGRGLKLRIRGGQPLSFPVRATPPQQAPWIGESRPIPVKAFAFATTDPMEARKMGIIVSMTRELARRSTAEIVFNQMLQEEAAFSLDAAYFSTDAGDDDVHQGLLFGLTPLVGTDDMLADLSALAAAVSTTGASGEVVFITSPARAAVVRLHSMEVSAEVLASAVLADDRIVALDPRALAHGAGPDPEITASQETLLHMSDTPATSGPQGRPRRSQRPRSRLFRSPLSR